MEKTITRTNTQFRLFGVKLFDIKQNITFWTIDDDSEEIEDELLLYERIDDLKNKERYKIFKRGKEN